MSKAYAKSVYIFGALCLFTLTACSSPVDKVKQKEAAIEQHKEDSGFNECMRKVVLAASQLTACIDIELAKKGIVDDVHCMDTPGNSICTPGRYNTEVASWRICTAKGGYATTLTEGNCREMLIGM